MENQKSLDKNRQKLEKLEQQELVTGHKIERLQKLQQESQVAITQLKETIQVEEQRNQ